LVAVGDRARDNPAQAVAGPAAVAQDEPPAEDPFPIRRLRATEAQLAELLKPPDFGPLVRLPRGDFEGRVRAAGRAAAEARHAPRVTETRWKASLVGSDLDGTAELEIAHPAAQPTFLPLDPLRLALGPASWADGREAVVGLPAGSSAPAVWVGKPGAQTLKFAWSVAGVAEPGERRFELRVPAAMRALFELELPAGQVPAVPATDVLVTGPFPLPDDAGRALWRFRFGGRSRLDFSVRSGGAPGATAAAVLKATYDLTPGQLACAFEYEFRPAKGTIGQWEFTVDAGLRVTNVEVNDRAGWSVDTPAEPNAPRRLRVALRQPGAGGKVLVSAVAPHPDPSRAAGAPLPAIRPVGANLDDETLTIRLAPELRPADWNSGDYRLSDSLIRPDQSRELTLTGTLVPAKTSRPFRRLPMIRTSMPEAEFATTEQLSWRLGPDRATATLRVEVRVRRGPLFQFALRPPAGYSLARQTGAPDGVAVSSELSGGRVAVEFARPLAAGQSAELIFEFRSPALPPGAHQLPFPALTPLRAAERNGVVSVFIDPVWLAEVQPGVGTTPVGWLDLDAPPPEAGAAAAFRYRGDDPDGQVTLTPARAEFAVETSVRAEHTPAGLRATTPLTIRVARGGLPGVAVLEPARGGAGRTWRVTDGGNAVAAAVPLPLPGAPLAGRIWLVRFERPATAELTLETTATNPTGELAVLGAARTRVPAVSAYHPPAPRGGKPAWGFSGLYLVTAARTPRDVLAVFGGTVTGADVGVLPVTLPLGAELRAASVGGRWLDPGVLRLSEGVLHLPIASAPARFEVRYRLPVEPGVVVHTLRSPLPGLPTAGVEVGRWWAFGAEVLPGWPVRAWDRESADSLPGLLGDGPLREPGAIVWQSPVEEMRVATARLADVVGIVVAAGLFALAWAGACRRHPFCGVLAAAVLFALGVGLLLGPPWWQRVALVPLAVGLLAAGGMVVARGRWSRVPAAAVLALAVCLVARSDSAAQPAAPATVVILPAGADGREVVVAPKELLDRLAAAARPVPPGVVVTSAEYTVTADETTARVAARFTAHAFHDDATATLPLADARLERVTVDGTAAFPASPRPGTYTVPLAGKGRHEVEVRFTVPVAGVGTEREFRFGVPEVPAARVVADLPGSARQPQVVGRVGRQSVTAGERVRLETDVGALRSVQVRWRDGEGGKASVKVREGCVWDVTEDGAELTACYLVRIDQGAVPTLRYEVPAELDVLAIAVRPLDEGGSAALRDWSVGGEPKGFRPLQLDFRSPIAGRVLVVLTLAPREPLGRQPALRFPRTAGAAGEPDAVYGLRAKGVVVEELGRGGVIDFSPDALTRDFAAVADLRLDPQTPVRVFRPTPGGVPVLRPTLRVAAELPAFTLNTAWHLGVHRADAQGTVRWSVKDAVALVEFTLPVIRLAEVRGPEVASWAQTGTRVHVWLKRPVAEGEIAWLASVPRPTLPFEAPTPRPISGTLAESTLRLAAATGFGVEVERSLGWTADEGHPGLYRTTSAAAEPVRVTTVTVPPALRDEELGWLAPSPRSVSPAPPPKPIAPPARVPEAPNTAPPAEPSRWVASVTGTAAWCAAVVVLGVLLVRWPGSTWPEQLGLIGGLFGAAVAGGWWVGVLAWAAARLAWLGEYASRVRNGEPANP
jgi:hypothetical protein